VPDRPETTDHRALLQLLRRQSEEAVRFAAVFGRLHGLHQTDVAALAAISDASAAGSPMGPARLAETLRLSRPATTALVDRLVGAGHLVRRADPEDRRRTVLEMQPAALELASAFFGPLGAAFRRVLGDFSAAELDVVAAFLRAVTDATVQTREGLAADDGPGGAGAS